MYSFDNLNFLKDLFNFFTDETKYSIVLQRESYSRERYVYIVKSKVGKGIFIYGFDSGESFVEYESFNSDNLSHYYTLNALGIFLDGILYVKDFSTLFGCYHNPTFPTEYANSIKDFYDFYREQKKEISKKVFNEFYEELECEELTVNESISRLVRNAYIKNIDKIELDYDFQSFTQTDFIRYFLGDFSLENLLREELENKREYFEKKKSEYVSAQSYLDNITNEAVISKKELDILKCLKGLDCKTVQVTYAKGSFLNTVKIEREQIISAIHCCNKYINSYRIQGCYDNVYIDTINKITFSRKTLYEENLG